MTVSTTIVAAGGSRRDACGRQYGTVIDSMHDKGVKIVFDGHTDASRVKPSLLQYSDEYRSSTDVEPGFHGRGLGDSVVSAGHEYLCMARMMGLPEWQEPYRTMAAIERHVACVSQGESACGESASVTKFAKSGEKLPTSLLFASATAVQYFISKFSGNNF